MSGATSGSSANASKSFINGDLQTNSTSVSQSNSHTNGQSIANRSRSDSGAIKQVLQIEPAAIHKHVGM